MREPVDTPRYLLDFDIHLILSIYCSQKIEVGSVVRSLVLDILTEPAKQARETPKTARLRTRLSGLCR